MHWPVELRGAFDALFAIDDAMADVVRTTRDPNLAAIKLAWWREQLQALDEGPPPAEPRLQAVARELLVRDVRGADLAELEGGWTALLQPSPEPQAVANRGSVLFAIGCRLLGVPFSERPIGAAGRTYAEADAIRRGMLALEPHGTIPAPVRIAGAARPLTALAALAARDLRRGTQPLEPEATPARSFAILRHRLTGSLQLLT